MEQSLDDLFSGAFSGKKHVGIVIFLYLYKKLGHFKMMTLLQNCPFHLWKMKILTLRI